MKVNEYIYRNWANWNFAILKQLCEDEGIEWSEGLVAYLKTTPTNTNWSMLVNFGIDPYGSDEGGSNTVTLTAIADAVEYYTECGGEARTFSDTLVIPKGTTLYFDTSCYGEPGNGATSTEVIINGESLSMGKCVPFTFTEDANVSAILAEC